MFSRRNNTPYSADSLLLTDADGRDMLVVVVKGSFVDQHGRWERIAEQPPLLYADEYWGDPAETSVRIPSNATMFKPCTDVVVQGHAYAPNGQATTEMELSFALGSLHKQVRVFGDRHWEKQTLGMRPSRPRPFEQLPLLYERSFGGRCPVAPDSDELTQFVSNPVGLGYFENASAALQQPLPNYEDPDELISSWKDRPPPAGFGPLAADWEPRRAYAGTYDEAWQRERMPLLPADFDDRFFNVAPADQQASGFLQGGEAGRLVGFTPDGEWTFTLPHDQIRSQIVLPMEVQQQIVANLDTVILQPDARVVQLVWRAQVRAPHPVTHLLHVDISSDQFPPQRQQRSRQAEVTP